MKKKLLAVILLLISTSFLHAQIRRVALLQAAPTQYEKTEWNISLISKWVNPFLQEDIALDMIITSPTGKKLVLPCYYESGESGKLSEWKARFTPQEAGKYKYSMRLTKENKVINTSKLSAFSAKKSKKDGFLHAASNWAFKFDSGKPFRGIGENLAWESRDNDDSKFFKQLHENSKYDYSYMLPSLSSHGGNFFRTWICSWNLPLDWKNGINNRRYTNSTEYYNPSAIKRMDALIRSTDSLGLYIMLTLGPGAYHLGEGGFANSAADFFVNPRSKSQYKNRLRYIVARWGYSPSIAAWEFFNEVDNVQFANKNSPISEDSIVMWHDEMSTYLKQIDPYGHLTTTSISHRDLKGLNSLKNIDFNQKHIYKNTKGIPEAIAQYENNFSKPYVIGEYSYEWDWSKNFNEFAPEMDSDFKRGLWYGLFSPTPVLPLSWWWEYFDNRGTDTYFSRIKAISDQMLKAGNGRFEQVAVSSSGKAEVFGVRCGEKLFIYTYNPADSSEEVDINLNVPVTSPFSYQVYDCESGKLDNTKREVNSNKPELTGIKLASNSDQVLIIHIPTK